MSEAKPAGNIHLNGHSLASLSGAKSRLTESVRFDVRSIDEALEQLRRLGATGELTLKINQGRVSGEAQFDSHVKVSS
jgi:hypothetical protein